MTDIRSDADLLAAHAAGDRRAFAELVSRHHARLHRLARRRCRSAEEADDALQDALISAHRRAGSFRREAAVGTWLHRIVVNACIDRTRRIPAEQPVADIAEGHAPLIDRTGQSDTALLVHRALMRLPIDQRAAVLAVDMHGYSVAEAARLLDVAQGTVKSRRARARARLAVLLGPAAG